MPNRGKKYRQAEEQFDRDKVYSPTEALGLVKQMAKAGFDETIELSARLGIDARKADQLVRGSISLPRGTGKEVRVVVFAQADKAREAREAGADEVGDNDLAEKIQKGWTDFDVAIATPDMMPVVGKLGRIEYRNDKHSNVHTVIGKASFDTEALTENYLAVIEELQRVKPSAAKGKYLKSITVSSTMGPGIRIDTNRPKGVEVSVPTGGAEAT